MKILIASLLCSGLLLGSNGKITGVVSQKENGEPGVGVNIIIVDSYLGAATDANGRFSILNVPPGTYTLRADAIGFMPIIMKSVRVTTAQTTEINFQLEEAASEVEPKGVSALQALVE